MIFFSVPADFNESTLEKFDQLNGQYTDRRINEVYGQLTTGDITASGRMTNSLPQVNLIQLKRYIRSCEKHKIDFNYTLNASCLGNAELNVEFKNRMLELLLDLAKAGVSAFTVAMPSLINMIRTILPHIPIKVSAISEINSPEKAMYYKRLQVRRIVIDPDITRCFQTLQDICSVFGKNVEIIVNNVCLKNCPNKMFHYNHEAHCVPGHVHSNDEQYYYHQCSLQKAENDSNYIKLNWIRPEDLKYYINSGIHHFKIQGRNYAKANLLLKVIESYFSEDFDGNLMDLLTLYQPYNAFQPQIVNKQLDGFIDRFYHYPGMCRGLCESCGYCLTYAEKSMDIKTLKQVNAYARQFYKGLLMEQNSIGDKI